MWKIWLILKIWLIATMYAGYFSFYGIYKTIDEQCKGFVLCYDSQHVYHEIL